MIDEIGTHAETLAARTISQRGVQLIATAHGSELDSIVKNPSLVDLIGGVGSVTLGARESHLAQMLAFGASAQACRFR